MSVDVSEATSLLANNQATVNEIKEMVKRLKTAEFTQVNATYDEDVTSQYVGMWTETGGTSINSGQHWDGTTTSTYMEQSGSNWGKSSWSISYKQTLSLPAGKYLLKVAGRSSTSVIASMSVGHDSVSFPHNGDTGYGIDVNGNTNFSPEGTYANFNAGRGWEWRYIPFVMEKDGVCDVSLQASTQSAHQWVSFCSVSLLRVQSSTDGISTQNVGVDSNETIYNIQGQAMGNSSQWLTNTLPRNNVYIINHKKYIPIVRR